MLTQKYRFHGYGSLKFLYRAGKMYRARSLSMRAVRNERRTDSRVAIIVTKKVYKSAPRRNRIRRRMYEIVRKNFTHIKPSYDIVFNVYDPQVLVMPHDQLEGIVVDVLRQAEIWKESQNNDPAAH